MGINEVNEPDRTSATDSQPELVPDDMQGEGGSTPGERQASPKLDDVPPNQDTMDESRPESPGIALSQKRPPSASSISAGRWHSRLTLAISLLSLVVITIHAYFYNKQWRVMTKQAELIERQIKQSTEAFTLQERAWIFMEGSNYSVGEREDLSGAKANRAKTDLVFRNTGNTPALNTMAWFCAQIREQPLPEDASKPQLPALSCREIPFGIIGPNAVFNIGQADEERVVDAVTAAKLDSNELKLYIWGVIEYEDFFQRRHMTRFCFTNSTGKLVAPCENNNRAD
jgi:hypothetical protein